MQRWHSHFHSGLWVHLASKSNSRHAAQCTNNIWIWHQRKHLLGCRHLCSELLDGSPSCWRRLCSTPSDSRSPAVSTTNSWTEKHWALPLFAVISSGQVQSQAEHRVCTIITTSQGVQPCTANTHLLLCYTRRWGLWKQSCTETSTSHDRDTSLA